MNTTRESIKTLTPTLRMRDMVPEPDDTRAKAIQKHITELRQKQAASISPL